MEPDSFIQGLQESEVDDAPAGVPQGGGSAPGLAHDEPFELGRGYATEALAAVVALGGSVLLDRLYALCHPDNAASVRVLEKCGFVLEERLEAFDGFPNLESSEPRVCLKNGRTLAG